MKFSYAFFGLFVCLFVSCSNGELFSSTTEPPETTDTTEVESDSTEESESAEQEDSQSTAPAPDSDSNTDSEQNVDSENAELTEITDVTESTSQDLAECAVDVHLHFNSNITFASGATQLLEKMATLQIGDETGLSLALLQPPPTPCPLCDGVHYTYEDNMTPSLETIVDQNATKFGLVAGGGELSPIIHAAVVGSVAPTTAQIDTFRQQAESLVADGVLAFGEMAALHLSFVDEHPFIQMPADHAYFLALAEVAAQKSVPIDIHLEAVNRTSFTLPDDMPKMPDGKSCFKTIAEGGNNPTMVNENITAFKALLTHNYETAVSLGDASRAKIVWSHVGWDNTGDLSPTLVKELLTAHPNLYASLKMLDSVGPCQVVAHRPLDENGELQDDWNQLFEEFPDRFVLGSDEFTGNAQSITADSASLQGTWNLIAKLPEAIAYKFACENPRLIYNIE